jgi:iron(III) transport system substrate-binding protein
VYNTGRFAKEMPGLKPPTVRDDLVDPGWKAKLILPDPAKTGGGYIFLATQVFRFNRDEDKAMEFMKKLHANIAQYVGAATEGIQPVAEGQFVGCPNWAHDIITSKNQGKPVDLVVPNMTGFEVGAVRIIKGGPNTVGAWKFVDWVLTREAGKLNVELSNRLSTRDDVVPAFGAPTLGQVSLVDYDRAWASGEQDRLIQKWKAAIA